MSKLEATDWETEIAQMGPDEVITMAGIGMLANGTGDIANSKLVPKPSNEIGEER
jgi:hypothetical protein